MTIYMYMPPLYYTQNYHQLLLQESTVMEWCKWDFFVKTKTKTLDLKTKTSILSSQDQDWGTWGALTEF